ncbi:MAG TPA: hypothetical protein DHV57_05300 [Hyphomonas sp.]|jgi:hypothetical protein|nr:hypothetical protein [Hyphomonadaceae bacterium]HCJ16819.1 hypothetical protein [Hyphomonas sp.]|tara:strand:- start:1415 stop:1609 length:195 start_codon:yes stop_codon:yes gene_type:complete
MGSAAQQHAGKLPQHGFVSSRDGRFSGPADLLTLGKRGKVRETGEQPRQLPGVEQGVAEAKINR